MNEFKPENQELWDLCMKHGGILARREKISQIAILDMYDEIKQLQNTSSDISNIQQALKKLAENQTSLTSEMIEVINENFWELF